MATDLAKHLLHVFPSFVVGGSQMRFARLVAAHGNRYRHTVISLDGRLDMADRLPPSVPVTCKAAFGPKRSTLVAAFLARKTLRAVRPDVLVTYNWGAIEWCLANRWGPLCRHVHIEDGFGLEERSLQLKRRVWTRRLALSGNNNLTVVPSRQLEQIARRIWRLPENSVRYIPNGIDCARFRVTHKKASDGLTIGTVATLRPEKNLSRLIRLCAPLMDDFPSLRLVIVGDGPERERLHAEAGRSGHSDRIVFAGATTEPERFLAEMDVFALSSDTEQMPLSVLEAMAASLPVVSFNVGDTADMVAAENAPYASIARENDAAYTAAMRTLLNSSELRRAMGLANNAAALHRFSQQTMVEQYSTLFG